MAERVCFIVGGGELDPSLRLAPEAGDLLIAADAGLAAVDAMGLVPDLVIGDFDSLGEAPRGDNVVVLPRVKDDTDTAAAVKAGLSRGYRRFALYGGTGGRLAHTLANLQLLHGLSARACRGFLIGGGTVCTAVTDGELRFPAGLAGYLSVFCSGAPARGVTLSGLKYPLDRADLTAAYPLGVSNEFTGESARVSVERGTLLVLWQGADADPTLLRTL